MKEHLIVGGGTVQDIVICCLPYKKHPFVHGWIMTDDGPYDLWLRNDGLWTTDEENERNNLMLSEGFKLPNEPDNTKQPHDEMYDAIHQQITALRISLKLENHTPDELDNKLATITEKIWNNQQKIIKEHYENQCHSNHHQ